MRHTMYTFSTATQRIQVSRASVERAAHGRSIIDRMLREKTSMITHAKASHFVIGVV